MSPGPTLTPGGLVMERRASRTAAPSYTPAFSTASAAIVKASNASPTRGMSTLSPYSASYSDRNVRVASLSGVPGAVP